MRIMYWTTACLEPRIEAVSKEVAELAVNFKDSFIFSVSPHLLFKLSGDERCFGVNSHFDPILRLIIPFIEMRTDVNHVYSEISPWIFYKTLKKKPTVLTIASEKGAPVKEFLEWCRIVAVQTEHMQKRLADYGIDQKKLRLIYPGLDLSRFAKKSDSPDFRRPKVLFATLPRTEEELAARGAYLLIETAKRYPEIEFHFMFRPWRTGYTSLSATTTLLNNSGIANVKVTEGFEKNMGTIYSSYDFTVIPYTTKDGGKECPRSLIESLACGVPVLISDVAPFASFVARHNCGRVFSLCPEGFASAVEDGLKLYDELSASAHRCAHVYFDRDKTVQEYASIYSEITGDMIGSTCTCSRGNNVES